MVTYYMKDIATLEYTTITMNCFKHRGDKVNIGGDTYLILGVARTDKLLKKGATA